MGKAPRDKKKTHGVWWNDGSNVIYTPYDFETSNRIIAVSVSAVAPSLTGNQPSKIDWEQDFYIPEEVKSTLRDSIDEGSTVLVITNHYRKSQNLTSVAVSRHEKIIDSFSSEGIHICLISSSDYSPKPKLLQTFVSHYPVEEYEVTVVGHDFYGCDDEGFCNEQNQIYMSDHICSYGDAVRGNDFQLYNSMGSEIYTAEQFFGSVSYRDVLPTDGNNLVILISVHEEENLQVAEYAEDEGYELLASRVKNNKIANAMQSGENIFVLGNLATKKQRSGWIANAEKYGYDVVVLINCRYGQFFKSGDESGSNLLKLRNHSECFEYPDEADYVYCFNEL